MSTSHLMEATNIETVTSGRYLTRSSRTPARRSSTLPTTAITRSCTPGGTPVPGPHEWRHDSEATHRPGYYPCPPEQREIVRHKTYELHRISPDDAVYDMEALDYDVHLFTDATIGQDAVVYRAGPTGYRLARLHPTGQPEPPTAIPLTVSPRAAPQLSDREAVEWLNLTGQPFCSSPTRTNRPGPAALPPLRRPPRPDHPRRLRRLATGRIRRLWRVGRPERSGPMGLPVDRRDTPRFAV